MKCLAGAVMYSKKVHALATEYGYWMLEWCDVVIGVALVEKHGFGQKRLQSFYDETRRGLSGMIGKYVPDRMFVDKWRGRVKGDCAERIIDGADTVIEVVAKRLAEIGIERDKLDSLEPKDNFNSKKRNEILCHAARQAWYEANGRRAVTLYVAYLLFYMNEQYGFGQKRLNELADSVIPLISGYLTDFFRGNIKIDNEMKKTLDGLHEKLAVHGIEFEEIPDEDRVNIQRKSVDDPITLCSAGEMSKYNDIMQEVKKQNMRRYI